MEVGYALERLRAQTNQEFVENDPEALNFFLDHLRKRTKLFTSHNRTRSGPYAGFRRQEIRARNRQIWEEYYLGGFSQADLAIRHDLTQGMISKIIGREEDRHQRILEEDRQRRNS